MSDAITTDFRAGESLEWARREGDTLTKRSVRFVEPFGSEAAVVSFGVNGDGAPARYTAPLIELSRPSPPSGIPPYHQQRIEPPKPPAPPTEPQVNVALSQRRYSLRMALHRQREAKRTRDAAAVV